MATISTSTWRPSPLSLTAFDTGKVRALETPGPAPCIRAIFPCQPVTLHFSVRRCVRSKIDGPPPPQPSLLRGAAVFERFRVRPRSRWRTPRYQVRHSRSDTSYLFSPVDGVLLERAAGPLSRCPSALAMIPAAMDTYSTTFTCLSADMRPPELPVLIVPARQKGELAYS